MNGHAEVKMNGHGSEKMNGHVEQSEISSSEKFEVLMNGNCEAAKETLPVAKSSKKKVSFHDNVTDIDADREPPITANGDYVEDNQDETKTLRDILNISEKINFFKNAFSNGVQTIDDNGHKPHGHQSSIPEARLAFVAGMVDRSLTGNNSRADKRRNHVDSDVTNGDGSVTKKDEEDTEPKTKSGSFDTKEVPRSPEEVRPSEGDTASDMAATEVTYLKVFATQKIKNGFTE
ncbi:uncharacterized protein LOC118188369, partial [Stegodyphus dumicola]|uniref:uncharacterized protein LOC118188369 n=1 Tax=Stegodyphus dumicola TaxID=202533 RepID=UPI0015B05A6E